MADNELDTTEEEIELTDREIEIAQGSFDEDDGVEASEESELESEPVNEVEEEVEPEPEPEPEAELEPEPEPEPEPEAPSLSDEDYRLGESVGLSREDVDDLGSTKAVNKYAEKHAELFNSNSQQSSEDSPDSPVLDISQINLEDYDDVTKAAFQAIDSLQTELASIRKQRDAFATSQEDAQLEAFNKSLDSLDGDFYGEAYKSGSGRMSDVGKEAMSRRMQLAEAIDTLSAGYVSKGKEVPPLETLVEDAHKMTFKDRVSEVASKSKKGRLKKQASRRQSSGRQSSKQAKSTGDAEEDEIMRIMRETEDAYNNMLEDNGSR